MDHHTQACTWCDTRVPTRELIYVLLSGPRILWTIRRRQRRRNSTRQMSPREVGGVELHVRSSPHRLPKTRRNLQSLPRLWTCSLWMIRCLRAAPSSSRKQTTWRICWVFLRQVRLRLMHRLCPQVSIFLFRNLAGPCQAKPGFLHRI